MRFYRKSLIVVFIYWCTIIICSSLLGYSKENQGDQPCSLTSLLSVGNYWVYKTDYPNWQYGDLIDSLWISTLKTSGDTAIFGAKNLIGKGSPGHSTSNYSLFIIGDTLFQRETYRFKGSKRSDLFKWAVCPLKIGLKWTEVMYLRSSKKYDTTKYKIVSLEDKIVNSGEEFKGCYKISVTNYTVDGNINISYQWFEPNIGRVCYEWTEGTGAITIEAQMYLKSYFVKN